MTSVRYFEIPVTDLGRAVAFYSYVFGLEFELADIDGNEMALFPETEGGASGALAKGESYRPSPDGPRLYFTVESIDETMARALERGGRELYPKTDIGDLGFVAEFSDSEGNCIALSSAS